MNASPFGNRDVAAVLARIADLLDILGEDPRRARAYRRAAQAVENEPRPLAQLQADGALQTIPGVGPALAERIGEILASGRCALLDELEARVPASVLELLNVPGIGPRTVHVLYTQLGICTADELEAAAAAGQLRALPGFGPKKEAKILEELQAWRRRLERTLIAAVEPLALQLVNRLAALTATEQAAYAGSLRRGRETVGDLDLVAASPRPAEVIEAFCAFPEVAAVDARGTTRASVRLEGGLQCDLRVVERPAFPAALQYFTGSQAHNVRLRALARARGYKLNEYGLFRLGDGSTTGQVAPDEGEAGEAEAEAAAGERVPAPDEHHLYGHLGLPYIPPELREDRGEVEAALAGRLPRLIKLRDIRGDLHVHSNWSDGRHSIEEMHARAAELGYEYLAITDHSPSLVVAKGLTVERLRRQLEEIRELRQRLGPPYLLAGIEVDIRGDGSLDLPDDVLAELDIVVASVHSRLTMDEAEMTRRIVRAIENPHVDIIGHATGRVLGRRDAYRIDAEAVLAAAARTGTLVEINASPERLDVPDVLARRACQLGARLVINSDAHATAALGGLLYGIKVARRAWLEPERVVNTWPLERLRAFLAKPKGERARTV